MSGGAPLPEVRRAALTTITAGNSSSPLATVEIGRIQHASCAVRTACKEVDLD